jgi:two-component system chemotaxis response regulator CheB
MIRLLIVDDSPLMRQLLIQLFAEAGDFTVEVARNADEALEKIGNIQPDVITLDVHMPGMDGLACLDRIMIERPTPVVMLSSLTEAGADETLEALALGAVDFIAKPRGPLSLEIEGIAADLSKGSARRRAPISRAARASPIGFASGRRRDASRLPQLSAPPADPFPRSYHAVRA